VDPARHANYRSTLNLNRRYLRYSVHMRRAPDTLLPLEADILSAAFELRVRGVREWHGYGLAEHMEDVAHQRATGYGTLYRTLARLEGRELLSSRWESSEDARNHIPPHPPRRLYHLTSQGETALREWARTNPAARFRPRLMFETAVD
jgi:PadR family transcriptional regulator, regulatory protein PadR